MRRRGAGVILAAAALALVSCPLQPSTAPASRRSGVAGAVAAIATPALIPTATLAVTRTGLPDPTITSIPTATPSPSNTSTPLPTVTPTSMPSATPELTGTAALETRLIDIINSVRAGSSLPPYRPDAALSDAARAHSCDMAVNSFIGHTSSDGRSVAERMPPAEPPWVWPSESVAAGSDDPQVIVDMWMNEPPDGWHRRNILDGEQQVIGAGYCFRPDDPTGNMHYWTIDITRAGP